MIHRNTSLPYQTNEILATRKYKGKTTITTRANQTNTMKKTKYEQITLDSWFQVKKQWQWPKNTTRSYHKYQTRIQYYKQLEIDKYMHKKHH